MIYNSKLLYALVFLFSTQSFAGNHDGALSMFDVFFGNPNERSHARDREGDNRDVSSDNCSGYGGIIGEISGFFCHMEKDMGFTGPDAKTKVFGSMTVRAEIVKTPTSLTYNGISETYDHKAQVWVCAASCSITTNFNRAYYIIFSYSADGTVNKGFVLNSPGIFDGRAGTAMMIQYDLGTAAASNYVNVKAVFKDNIDTFKMDGRATKLANILKVNMIFSNGSSNIGRMAGVQDITAGKTKIYFENTAFAGNVNGTDGIADIDAAAQGAISSVDTGVCLVTGSSGSSSGASAGTGCSASAFSNFAASSGTVNAYTAAAVLMATGTAWNGMAANPSSI